MKNNRFTTFFTIFLFIFLIFSGSLTDLYSQSKDEDKEISELYKKAEEFYENGSFNQAIDLYEKIIDNLNKKKELAKTKQKLFKTMVSLALTLFTIKETEKAKSQLKKLIRLNPNEELDREIYPPAFIEIFEKVQKEQLGSLNITSIPPGAELKINNRPFGKTPVKLENFLKGEYVISAFLKGYSPYSGKISVKENNSNSLDIKLLKKGKKQPEKRVVEKKSEKKKKKKKSPVLLIAGGIAAAAVLVLLLTKKKSADKVVTKTFTQNTSTSILAIIPAYSSLEVTGINGPITSVEFNVVVEHPKIEELSVNLVSPDNRTIFNIWNKGPHAENGKTFQGTTSTFNTVSGNGAWKLGITNSGTRKTGRLVKWQLRISYTEK